MRKSKILIEINKETRNKLNLSRMKLKQCFSRLVWTLQIGYMLVSLVEFQFSPYKVLMDLITPSGSYVMITFILIVKPLNRTPFFLKKNFWCSKQSRNLFAMTSMSFPSTLEELHSEELLALVQRHLGNPKPIGKR